MKGIGTMRSGVSIEVRSDPVVVNSIGGTSEPDLAWDYTDEAGHYHWWVDEGERPTTPTLISVQVDSYWCPDCEEAHEEYETQCRICGEAIEPGYRTTSSGAYPTVIPGPTTVVLHVNGDEVPVGSDEYQALRAFRQGSGEEAMAEYARKLAERLPE